MMKPIPLFFSVLLAVGAVVAKAGELMPLRFGPYLQQGLEVEGDPAGARYIPPEVLYNVQVGWMEPLNLFQNPVFHGTYLETQGNATISRYQSDVGVVFNLKPIRFLEGGLAYNRLLFPYSLIGFNLPTDSLPNPAQWRTPQIYDLRLRDAVGADVFTYQGNFTFDVGRLQFYGGGFSKLWDVDVTNRNIILDYRTGLLIQIRDRLNSVYAQTMFKLDPGRQWLGFTARGVTLRDQYWEADRTGLTENLLSAEFTGLRHGRNDARTFNGLNGSIGYWTDNSSLRGLGWWDRFHLGLEWMWNIQILHLGEN